jgi:putative aldouronate transport system substrate-binding protein
VIPKFSKGGRVGGRHGFTNNSSFSGRICEMTTKRLTIIILLLIASVTLVCAEGKVDTTASEPPVTITTNVGNPTWSSYPDSPVAKEILKRLNVKVDILNIIPEKLTAMLASGDLPDLFVTSIAQSRPLIQAGYILALDELAKKYAPEMLKASPLAIERSKKYWSEGTGKLYCIPGFPAGGYEPAFYYGKGGNIQPNFRWSYYKELGYPKITNETDMLNVIAAMVRQHPKTEDGKRVYGIPITCDWGIWAYSIPFGSVYGFMSVGTWGMVLDVKTSELVDNYTNPNGSIWRLVKFYFKENQLGLFDEDTLVAKWSDIVSKAAAGQYVAGLFGSMFDPANANLNPVGDGYIELPMAWEGLGHWGGGDWRYGTLNGRVVSTKTKRPDKVMQYVNYVYSPDGARTVSSGVEGVHWDYKNGVPTMRPETLALKAAGGTAWDSQGISLINNFGSVAVHPKDKYPMDLFMSPDVFMKSLSPMEKDYSQHYGVKYPSEILVKYMKQYNQFDQGLADMRISDNMPAMPDDIKRIHGVCDNIITKGIPKCILAASEAEYTATQNQVFADLKAAGFDQVKEWYLKNWKEQKTILGPKAK